MEKTIRVNDITIEIYTDDTEEMILTKIAVALNTLKRFMYVSKNDDEYAVIKLEDSIKNASEIGSLIDRLSIDWPKVTLLEYCKLWLSLRQDLTNDPFYIFEVHDFMTNKGLMTSFLCPGSDYSYFYDDITNDEIEQMKIEVAESILAHRKSEEPSTLEYTAFTTDEEFYTLIVDFEGDLLDVFNNITLNKTTIFATYNDHYKVYKTFIPLERWLETYPTFIVMYSNLMISHNKFNTIYTQRKSDKRDEKIDDMFSKIFIKINKNNKLEIEFSLKLSSQNLSKEDVQKNILNVLGIENYNEIRTSFISGIYFIPNIAIDLFLLSDMALTNNYIKSYITIDETNNIKVSNTRAFVYFSIPNNDIILRVSMKTKTVDKSDKNYNLYVPKRLFERGSYLLKIRLIKARSEDDIKKFQETLPKLLNHYEQHYRKLALFYRKYIPTFTFISSNTEKKVKVTFGKKDIKELQVLDPVLFGHNYPRKCPKDRFPTVVGDGSSGRDDTFMFPKEGGYEYICESDTFPWFGLVKNENLKGVLTPELIPCCFKDRQDNREKTNTFKYYYGTGEEKKDVSKHIFTTNKILPEKRKGFLPPNIQRIMDVLDKNNKYMRYGVAKGPGSFLSCILEVMDTAYFYIDDEDEKIRYTSEMRNKISNSYTNFNLCRQECYDLDDDSIRNLLIDSKQYLDPRLFIELMKDYFNCDIYLFTRDEKTPNGRIELPRHTNGYFYSKNYKRNVIFIFYHTGGEVDVVDYPSCELIINNIEDAFGRQMFDIHNSYEGNTSFIFSTIFIESAFIQFTGTQLNKGQMISKTLKNMMATQYIDGYGKCRGIKFKNEMFVQTEPFKPLNLPLITENIDNVIQTDYDKKSVKHIIKQLQANVVSVYKTGEFVKEIKIIHEDIVMIIRTNFISSDYDKYPLKKENITRNMTNSSLLNFQYMEKLSRVLLETMYYLFSMFTMEKQDEKGDEKGDKTSVVTLEKRLIPYNFITTIINNKDDNSLNKHIEKFKEKCIVVDPKHIYQNTTFSREIHKNTFLFSGKKLIINDDELYLNLVYHLKMKLHRDLMYVFDYYKEKFLRNYFVNIDDFAKIKNNTILKGRDIVEENFRKMTRYEDIVFSEIRDEILISYNISYFFFNKLIDSKVSLVINFNTIKDALLTGIEWYERYHDPIQNNEIKLRPKYKLYKYRNKNSVESVIIDGEENNLNLKIIRLYLGDFVLYCTVLNLSYIDLKRDDDAVINIVPDDENVKKVFYVSRSNIDCEPDKFINFLKGPNFHKDSCYIDVISVAILNKFNAYIHQSFLERNVGDIQLIGNRGTLSKYEPLKVIVESIQSDLRDIYKNLQKQSSKYTCNSLRKNMDRYQTTYNKIFYPNTIAPLNWINIVDPNNDSLDMEPLDVIMRLIEIFSPEDALEQQRDIYVPKGDELKLVSRSDTFYTSPVIIAKFSDTFRGFENNCVPVHFLMNKIYESRKFSDDNLYKVDGVSYDYIIEKIRYISSSDFLHIHIPRMTSLTNVNESFCIVPTESIKIGNDPPLIVSSIIVRKGNYAFGHYVCYVRCPNGKWLYYDDREPDAIMKKVLTFDFISSQSITKHITDIIYMR